MTLVEILTHANRLIVDKQLPLEEVPAFLSAISQKSSISIYQIIETCNDLANANRSDPSPTSLTFAQMAHETSKRFLQEHGRFNFARVSHTVGVILKIKGEYHQARNYLRQSFEIFWQQQEEEAYSVSLGDYGSACFFIGEYEESIRALSKAYQLSLRYQSIVNRIEWSRGLGYTYNSVGQYDKALHYAQIALGYAEQIGSGTNEIRTVYANVYENLGLLEKSVEISEQTLRESMANKKTTNAICDLFNLARLHDKLNRKDRAVEYYQMCIDLAKKHQHIPFYIQATYGYGARATPAEAYPAYENLLEMARANGLDKVENDILGTLGHMLIDKDPKRAIDRIEQSVDLSIKRGDKESLIQDYQFLMDACVAATSFSKAKETSDKLEPLLEQSRNPELKWKAYQRMYLLRTHSFFGQTPPLAYLEQSIAHLDLFLDGLSEDADKVQYYQDKYQTYQLLVAHHIATNDYPKAFHCNELNKSKILAHSLRSAKDGGNQVDKAVDPATFELEEGSLYISFFRSDDALFVFHKLAGEPLLTRQLTTTKSQIQDWKKSWEQTIQQGEKSSLEAYQQLLGWLYEKLLQPSIEIAREKKVSNILFSPNTELLNIPLHAAFSDTKQYLIEEFAISYLPSLQMPRRGTKNIQGKNCLIISHEGKGTRRLTHVATEVDKISSCLPSVSLANDNSTFEQIKSHAPQCKIIHIASHSLFMDYAPESSYYQLANYLTAGKISKLSLEHVDLVFSASCQSARNTSDGIQEYNGLLRAWMLAGVGSLIGSIWNLDDSFAAAYAAQFYTSLDKSSLEAYCASVRFFLKSGAHCSPHYWAGIVHFK
ncbi:MAG: CHAT domain-containing tetratricopeptide repeat protein [Bacteroidota bacterium]